MPFKFSKYNRQELRECRDAFLDDCRQDHDWLTVLSPNDAWTDFVLDWFAQTRNPDHGLFAHHPMTKDWTVLRRGSRSLSRIPDRRTCSSGKEFMLDLVHATLVGIGSSALQQQRTRVISQIQPGRVLLGLESEWGYESPRHDILYDAAKLASVRASVKVMVFASRPRALPKAALLAAFTSVRNHADDEDTPWLCIDIPYSRGHGRAWSVDADLL